jgi:hypothetical protein
MAIYSLISNCSWHFDLEKWTKCRRHLGYWPVIFLHLQIQFNQNSDLGVEGWELNGFEENLYPVA